MKRISKWKLVLGLSAVLVIGVLAFKGNSESIRDKSIVQQSSWTDSEHLIVPGLKWIFPGLGEMLNVYAFTWLDMTGGDFDILKVQGTFPSCRYFSISVHTRDMKVATYSIKDYEIVPDDGQINPAVPGNPRLKGQKYTVYFVKEGVDVDPSLKNVRYVPAEFESVAITTRQYRADDDTSLSEVARPYPVVTALHKDMTPGIAPPSVGMDWSALNLMNFDEFEQSYDNHMAFQRANGNPNSVDFLTYSGAAMGPSKDNRYVLGMLGDDYSKVAVVGMAKAPTFENTRSGGAFVGGKNVRYWSFCHAEGRMGLVNACVNDDRMRLNSDGSVTLIIGPESIREAVEAAGLTYLPWTRNRTLYKPLMKLVFANNKTYDSSRIEKKTLLAFRQVLADPSWDGAIISKAHKYFDIIDPPPFDPTMDDRAEVFLGDAGPRGFVLSIDDFLIGLKKGDFSKAFSSSYSPAP